MSNGRITVADWLAAEKDFEVNLYDGQPSARVEVAEGSTRPWLILTAPHAVNHWRDGKLKVADRGTGGLVRILSANLGCVGVITAEQTYSDAAYDEEHEFKDMLRRFEAEAAVLIDFHGMADQRDVDVEIGLGLSPTDSSEKLARHIASNLEEARLQIAYNEVYVSPNPGSITNWALARNVAATQLELAARVRPPVGSEEACAVLLETLEDTLAVRGPEALLVPLGRSAHILVAEAGLPGTQSPSDELDRLIVCDGVLKSLVCNRVQVAPDSIRVTALLGCYDADPCGESGSDFAGHLQGRPSVPSDGRGQVIRGTGHRLGL